MRKFRLLLGALIINLSILSISFCGVSDEFLALGNAYSENFSHQDFDRVSLKEAALNLKEKELSEKLLSSADELNTLSKKAAEIEIGLLGRLVHRIQFEVTQENQSELQPTLETFKTAFVKGTSIMKAKKKIANIGGRQVDLLDGEWNESPDGKRFWRSNEYPDIILTPADYRRYMATAVTVED